MFLVDYESVLAVIICCFRCLHIFSSYTKNHVSFIVYVRNGLWLAILCIYALIISRLNDRDLAAARLLVESICVEVMKE